MNPVIPKREISLPCQSGSRYIGLAFDGCSYYMLLHGSRTICRYNPCFECTRSYETCRCYYSLCYDGTAECFWASSRECPNTVFQLDDCMQETDKFYLTPKSDVCGTIMGLSYDCAEKTLLVAFPKGIVSFCPRTRVTTLLHTSAQEWITGVLSIHPGYAVTQICGAEQSVNVYNGCNKRIHKEVIPAGCIIEQILYCPCDDCGDELTFCALVVKKGCYPKVIFETVPCEATGFEISCCYKKICKRHCGGKPCCEHKCDHDCDCKCDCECKCKCDGEECKCDCKCKCGGGCGCGCGCGSGADVMESIALVEAALSHILNAEGEKLQKILATTDDIETILRVNQSIHQTIVSVTHVEQLLYEKLVALERICGGKCEPECECCCKPCEAECREEIICGCGDGYVQAPDCDCDPKCGG